MLVDLPKGIRLDEAAQVLEPNSSALLILFEHTWAAQVSQAMRNADGSYSWVPPSIENVTRSEDERRAIKTLLRP